MVIRIRDGEEELKKTDRATKDWRKKATKEATKAAETKKKQGRQRDAARVSVLILAL